ncbi:TraV family lipoprotein (plasmid) [Vibrio scophthalmi]|uniref:TraV family lipoprotein n=1 Tax=Vibrio scophthalmi TaxID=45658 RepID=UPI003EBB7868
MKNRIYLSLIMLSLTGCSIVGEEEAVCEGAENGVACASVREVYELTNVYNNANDYALATGDPRVLIKDKDGELISAKEYKEKYGTGKSQATQADNEAGGQFYSPSINSPEAAYQHQMLPAPEPMAMRKPADIVRFLAKPFTDNYDILQVPGYAFIEATNRTWVVDREARTNSPQLVNFHMRKKSQEQEYKVNHDGELGVQTRTDRPAMTDNELQEQAKQNAQNLMDSLRK